MMAWEDVRVQLVDLPAISSDFLEPWVISVVRAADAGILVVDLEDDSLVEAAEGVLDRLERSATFLVREYPEGDEEDESRIDLPGFVVANKADVAGAADRLEFFREWMGDRLEVVEVSTETGVGLDDLRRRAYDYLHVIRIYTKMPGKPVDRASPFTLPAGSCVLDLARAVHRDFEHSLKFARIWGTGVYEGQTVKRDHELRDRDVVELHV
jgi:ribosome-interacting GTPase 1